MVMIAVCPKCGYVFAVETLKRWAVCPRCGYNFPVLSHAAKWL